jgi:hypothetical protein
VSAIINFQRKKYLVKKEIKDTHTYQSIIKYIYPNKDSKTYKYYQDFLNRALVKIGIDDLFNIKILCSVIAFIVVFAVTQSSIFYKTKELASNISNKSSLLFESDPEEQQKAQDIAKKKEIERNIFEYLLERYDYDQLKKNEVEAVTSIAQDIQFSKLELPDENIDDLSRRLYEKLVEYYSIQQIDYFGILLVVILAFFLPDMVLYIRCYLIKFLLYNEYLQLEVIAIMVGKLEPIKVEEILNVMSENSKYFKRHIDEIRYNYFDIKNGHAKAFESVIEKISSKELRYLVKSLQQASESNIKIVVENLENQRKSNKEFRNIIEQNNLKKKDLVGIMVILIVLGAVCMYTFAPFQSITSNFSL